jgi:hypothetical protein
VFKETHPEVHKGRSMSNVFGLKWEDGLWPLLLFSCPTEYDILTVWEELSLIPQLQVCEMKNLPLLPHHSALASVLLSFQSAGSLWCRQSQQSFNTSTPPFVYFSFLLHVSAPMGHPQVRYTIRCYQGLFLLQRIRCTYTTWRMPISVLRPVVPNTCYQT